jgi:hypothetical protein
MKEACQGAVDSLRASDSTEGNVSAMYHAYPRPIDVAAVLSRHPDMLAIRKG